MLQLRQASESFNLFQCVVGRLDILTNQRLALGLPRHGPMLPNHSALQANPGSGTARHGNTMDAAYGVGCCPPTGLHLSPCGSIRRTLTAPSVVWAWHMCWAWARGIRGDAPQHRPHCVCAPGLAQHHEGAFPGLGDSSHPLEGPICHGE